MSERCLPRQVSTHVDRIQQFVHRFEGLVAWKLQKIFRTGTVEVLLDVAEVSRKVLRFELNFAEDVERGELLDEKTLIVTVSEIRDSLQRSVKVESRCIQRNAHWSFPSVNDV